MMFGLFLFLHLSGLLIWFGSLLTLVVLLLLIRNQLGTEAMDKLVTRAVNVFNWFAHPSSLVVLISGVMMIVQMKMGSNKPFWLDMMEKGGGTVILLALILSGVFGSRLKKRLQHAQPGEVVSLSGYLASNVVFIVSILAIVFIVSLRINL